MISPSQWLRALPYQLAAGLLAVPDEQQVEVTVRNDGSAGCALQLYHAYGTSLAPVHLALSAGALQTRRVMVPASGAYELELRGPNGFVRTWRGQLSDGGEIAGTLDMDKAELVLVISNASDEPLDVDITSPLGALSGSEQTVSVDPQSSETVRLATTDAWYDYVLVSAAGGTWRRELAGHIEGAASQTLAT